MKPQTHKNVYIRRADEEIYLKISHIGFGAFISDMINKYGEDYIADKVREEIKKLNKI